jgi:hypothetical protein
MAKSWRHGGHASLQQSSAVASNAFDEIAAPRRNKQDCRANASMKV